MAPQVRKRTQNTNKRHMLLMAISKFAGRKGGEKRYNLLHSSLYKALINYMTTHVQTNNRRNNIKHILKHIYNMPLNTGEIYAGRWWISPTHINPNTGRFNTVYIKHGNNNNMTVMAYNPATRRYNIAG
jgi:hypothetical protein